MELQGRVGLLAAQGYGVAVVTYDAVPILRRFADARGITYPLLSDAGSVVIRRYGLLNTSVPADSRASGVPYPGTFLLDRRGRVQTRSFEDAYEERTTVQRLLVQQGLGVGDGPLVSATTPHLAVTAAIADRQLAPGRRTTIVADVTPGPAMHVYAPGRHSYQVVRLVIEPQPWLTTHATRYPASSLYYFAPLDERVEVYTDTFRLQQDVTVRATKDAVSRLAGQRSLTLRGRLEYQACDDKICYAPAVVPLEWNVDLAPLVRPGGGG